jgi:hypothetical protein
MFWWAICFRIWVLVVFEGLRCCGIFGDLGARNVRYDTRNMYG